jgi:hypothetical protein
MNKEELNNLIYEALASCFDVETSLVSIFDSTFSRPPALRFRFRDKPKNDETYIKIKNIIARFEGKLKWEMLTNENTKNYLIKPSLLNIDNEIYLFKNRLDYISVIGEEEYEKKLLHHSFLENMRYGIHRRRLKPAAIYG